MKADEVAQRVLKPFQHYLIGQSGRNHCKNSNLSECICLFSHKYLISPHISHTHLTSPVKYLILKHEKQKYSLTFLKKVRKSAAFLSFWEKNASSASLMEQLD